MTTLLMIAPLCVQAGWRKRAPEQPSGIDRYVNAASEHAASAAGYGASPGSLYGSGTRLSDLVRDPRAYQVDDMVMIIVSDSASAIAKGLTSSSRKSSSQNSITSLAGTLPAAGPLANLATFGGSSKLDSQGQTSRSTQLTTSLAARVIHVLPNGYLVLEGIKDISVNSERQTVIVRGVCRPQDLSQSNTIASNRLAQLEVRINGKGVVGDAIRRPFILYRVLQGLLPF
ncbi:MAG: flagellar basal body L-ring protein FlgH [Bryobacterales bacterium]|nr:flagellar basal body L-ring protein FlgH [Bryobacterales bacterium]